MTKGLPRSLEHSNTIVTKVSGNSVTVTSVEELQAKYNSLASATWDKTMGAVSALNQRRLILPAGNYGNVVLRANTPNVLAVPMQPGSITRLVISTTPSVDLTGATTVSTVSQLRAAIGYWDDSGGSRVAGSADGGTIYIVAGNYGLGATDNILYPAKNTNVVGAGMDLVTITGRLFAKQSAATDKIVLEDFSVDINGNVAIPGSNLPATSAYGGSIVEDGRYEFNRVHVTNSAVTAGKNNFTSLDDGIKTVVVMNDCIVDYAEDDCVSVKSTSTKQAGTTLRAYNCRFTDPGSSISDQAITPHNDIPVHVVDCILTNTTTDGFAAAGATETDLLYLYNCYITGAVTKVAVAIGNHVDGQSLTDYAVKMSQDVDTYCVGNYIKGGTLARAIYCGGGSAAEKSYVLSNIIDEVGTGTSGTGVEVRAGTDVGNVYINNNYVKSAYRGIDVRECDGIPEIRNNIVDVPAGSGHYVILGISGAHSKNNVFPDINTVSTHTLDATDVNEPADIDSDYVPTVGGNCDGTGDATADISREIDRLGNLRKWKSTICIGPIEIPQGVVTI
ncbi:MAG: hypothetical protein KAR40_06085 [Candidatus Sabulitectum sp.]|nr:hypothetical protein [Candidatus Sabulitectum sp.]